MKTRRTQTVFFAIGAAFFALFVSSGCARDPLAGPLFAEAVGSKPGHARVYLYRLDRHHSYSTVEIRFDRRRPILILDEEYVTVELDEGTHEIDFRLKRRFWLPSLAWKKQRIRAEPGETLYFHVEVGVVERAVGAGRDFDIPGRSAGIATEAVSIRVEDESVARREIANTHLHIPVYTGE